MWSRLLSVSNHQNNIMSECLQRIIAITAGIFFPNVGAKAEIINDDGAQVAATEQAHNDED